MRIAIRGGHNYGVPGASAIIDEVKEDRKYYKKLKKYLKKAGHKVLDVTPRRTRTSAQDLNYGVSKANAWRADLFISCHLNAGGGNGCEVLYRGGSIKSKNYAEKISRGIAALGFEDRGAKADTRGLYELNHTNMPAIIIEPLFVDSKSDVKLYRKIGVNKLGKVIAQAVGKEKIAHRFNDYIKKYNLEKDKEDDRDYKASFEKVEELPQSIDLRYKMPPIFNQEELGSCTANAGVAARMVLKDISTVLSRLFLYYEERKLEGTVSEDSGASMRDICKALKKSGVCEESYMPYDIDKFADAPSDEAVNNAVNYKIAAYKRLLTLKQIKQYVANNDKGVLIGISVYESFESDEVAATGKVPVPHVATEQYLGGHAVYVVGYKDESIKTTSKCLLKVLMQLFTKKKSEAKSSGYLIVRNSWGTDWGDNGYFYLPYEFVEDGFAYDFWVIE